MYCLCVTQWHITRLSRKAHVNGTLNVLYILRNIKQFGFVNKKIIPTAFDQEYLKQISDRKVERKDEVVISAKVILFKDIDHLGALMTARKMHALFRENRGENHYLKVTTTANNRISPSVLPNPTFQAHFSA